MNVEDVACVIPTRGDVPLEPVLGHLPFAELGVWNNATGEDLSVYGRYAAIEHVEAPVILTLDDDCYLPPKSVDKLLAAYVPGHVVCNVPKKFRKRYVDNGLVGFGAIFDRDLPASAFERIGFDGRVSPFIDDDWESYRFTQDGVEIKIADAAILRRTCDIVFTMLTPMIQVDVPYENMDYASDDTRMWKQPGHFEEREQMRDLCRQILKAAA